MYKQLYLNTNLLLPFFLAKRLKRHVFVKSNQFKLENLYILSFKEYSLIFFLKFKNALNLSTFILNYLDIYSTNNSI
jgi:hypothetical protein